MLSSNLPHCLSAPGEYWIDPNEGSTHDAILVYCNFDNEESCILSNPNNVSQTHIHLFSFLSLPLENLLITTTGTTILIAMYKIVMI